MRQAVVNFDDEVLRAWGFEAFRDAGIFDTEILSCEGSRGVIRLRVEKQLDEHRLDETDTIQWWERVIDGESEHVYLVEVSAAELADDTRSDPDGFLRTEQVEVTREGITLTYTGSQERISEELAGLEAAGIDVALETLRGYQVQETLLDTLTDRQLEVLEVALDSGYYDVPRTATTEEVAADLDLDGSTVSEHLRRAERNLVSSVLGRSR